MNPLETDYDGVNDVLTKSEPDSDISECDPKELNCSSKRILFKKDNERCGEVLVGFQGNFTLVCMLCEKPFSDLTSFGSHIYSKHLSIIYEEETTAEVRLDPACDLRIGTGSHLQETLDYEVLEISPTEEGDNISEMNEQLEAETDLDESIQLDPSYDPASDDIPVKKRNNASQKIQEKEDFLCVLCCGLYKTGKSYVSHLRRDHENEILITEAGDQEEITVLAPLTMVCKYCNQKFNDVDPFREHVASHTGPNRFICSYCPKSFPSRYTLESHINTHTGERPYKCTHCPKAFSNRNNLQMHIRIHLGIMKYSCDYCGKRFVQSNKKKQHERTHTGEKPYQCEECGRRFISRVKLTEHERRHKNIKDYQCEVCDKEFYSSTLLKDHMTVHTGARPFHCTVCGQSFPRKKSLRAHAQLHSNEKKYVCNICGKAFAQFAGLYSHKRSHGKNLST
ncbi:unnamed protein product [Hermetia illucens]|uniref:C2H2-type domain-containing protein n=1 Tax=Hermetia illucens TaxID=343691 RepID=A0A7R8UTP9_HERIL|nr:zinc finger protein OZF-like [Hermetia illucens]CAD7086831.1 unnamed protein product [Hermetia illucens]